MAVESTYEICEPRTYRDFGDSGRFKSFRVVVETSDLYVRALKNLENETEALVRDARTQVESAIRRRMVFLKSLKPVEPDEHDSPLVLKMINAGKKAGTGPMASVAGAVAEYVGLRLLNHSAEIIIENGGDIFLKIDSPSVVGLFAGNSPFSQKIGIKVQVTPIPMGICTSSATVGPSLSLGKADASTVISADAALADAAATGMGNRIRTAADLKPAVEWVMKVPGVTGALAVYGDKMAAAGDIELVRL